MDRGRLAELTSAASMRRSWQKRHGRKPQSLRHGVGCDLKRLVHNLGVFLFLQRALFTPFAFNLPLDRADIGFNAEE